MTLSYHVKFRLFSRRLALAAEVPASDPERRAWVGVYPLPNQENCFNVRYFEVEKSVLEAEYDIAEDELLNQTTLKNVCGENELIKVLSTWLSDMNSLVTGDFCDYPI